MLWNRVEVIQRSYPLGSECLHKLPADPVEPSLHAVHTLDILMNLKTFDVSVDGSGYDHYCLVSIDQRVVAMDLF